MSESPTNASTESSADHEELRAPTVRPGRPAFVDLVLVILGGAFIVAAINYFIT